MVIQADNEEGKLLTTPINKMNLAIKGSPLEKKIAELYKELINKDIHFMPSCYLSDEWGCPHDAPIIAIPFYLADEALSRMEMHYTGIAAENEHETMMYLRHEAGHALNYAYELYLRPDWEIVFGSFDLDYVEDYNPVVNSKDYVIHLPDWYAQKHPDEDFAETFAVWLTPNIEWKEKYKGTLAEKKLEYVNQLMNEIKTKPPVITGGAPDRPLNELDMTLQEWYDSQ